GLRSQPDRTERGHRDTGPRARVYRAGIRYRGGSLDLVASRGELNPAGKPAQRFSLARANAAASALLAGGAGDFAGAFAAAAARRPSLRGLLLPRDRSPRPALRSA